MQNPGGNELSSDVFDRPTVQNRESRAMELLDGIGICMPSTTVEAVPVVAEKSCAGG